MIRLRLSLPEGQSERCFQADQVRIGSAPENDLRLPSALAADYHCRLARTSEGWEVIGGEGEVVLNGTPVRRQRLQPGDHIGLGEITLTILDAKAEEESAAPAGAAETPGEAGIVSAPIVPDTLRLAPPADSAGPAGAGPLGSGPPDPTKTCPYCGNEIPEAATVCRYCDEPLDPRARKGKRRSAGQWSLLSAKATATRGVSFRQMVEWVRNGTINENSSVSGPTTGFQWRFASETPGLSKYLGLCHRCGGPVSETDQVCGACGVDLDAPAEEAAAGDQAGGGRHEGLLRAVAAAAFLVAAAAGVGYLLLFTPLGRGLVGEETRRRVQRFLQPSNSRTARRGKGRPADRLRVRLEEAARLRGIGRYDAALQIYTDLRNRAAGTALADEIDAQIALTRRWRRANDHRVMGDAFLANQRPEEALRHYLIVREEYGDAPAARGLEERIAAARAALEPRAPATAPAARWP